MTTKTTKKHSVNRVQINAGDYILGFDPGGTTGFACIRYLGVFDCFFLEESSQYIWERRCIDTRLLVNKYARLAREKKANFYIVCENFKIYRDKAQDQVGSEVPSARVIGALEMVVSMLYPVPYGEQGIIFHMASEIQRVQIRDEHTALVGTSEHRKDAYKHARLFLAKNTRK